MDIMIYAAGCLLLAVGGAADVWLIRSFTAADSSSRRPARRKAARRYPRGPVVGLALGIGGAALAQPTPGAAEPSTAPVAPTDPDRSRISTQINFDITSAYFYRGIVQEDTGLIAQPAARFTVELFSDDDVRIDGFFGTWNSFHGQKTASRTHGAFSEYWYESDLYAGVTLTTGPIAITTSYTILASPSDAYETVQELGVTVALDDGAWLGTWALKPYATIALETGADASDGGDSDTGTYLELGIGPGLSFDALGKNITLTFPVAVGLSLSDYYQDSSGSDDAFGFAQAGVRASIPLSEGRAGTWTLNAGASYLLLGDHTAGYNGGDDSEFIATIGLQWNF